MDTTSLYFILALSTLGWLTATTGFYIAARRASHLAGATGSSCLFFTGAAAIASVLTDRWPWVLGLSGLIALLVIVHVISCLPRAETSTHMEEESDPTFPTRNSKDSI